jgi:AhpD family alkylhydroperoxidase
MGELKDQFNAYRQAMNDKLMSAPNSKVLKRIFNTDTNAYLDGALDSRTKEMLGLVASMVLRCDDCIRYHLLKCHELKITTEELMEVFGVANLVGGTIVVPHTRRALEFWEDLDQE